MMIKECNQLIQQKRMYMAQAKVQYVKKKRLNVTIQNDTKMINSDDVTEENIKEHDPNWPQIPDHPYRIVLIGGSGYGETNSLLN